MLTTSKGNSRLRSPWQRKKKNILPDLVGGCCGWFCGSSRSFLVGVKAGPPNKGARKGVGRHPPQVNPILRTGGGRNAWKACGCQGGAGLSLVPEPPTVGGVGTADLAFGGRGEESRTFPQEQRATYSPRPSYPRILFLLSHRGKRAIPSQGGPRVEPRLPSTPRTRAGEEESEGSALPGLFPLLSWLSLNGRRGRHFESKERRRRRRQRQGEGRMGGRGPAQPHRQAAGPGPQPPERGEEDRGEGADPRRLTEALHRRLRRASSVLHSHPPAGEGEREREGREEGGREGGRGRMARWARARGGGGERAGSSAVPALEPKPGARGFSRSRPSAPLLLFLAP